MGTHIHSLDTPVVDDIPVWLTDHWEFQSAPLNFSGGVGGEGLPGSPAIVDIPMDWGASVPTRPDLDSYGADDTIGQPVYVDSAGKVRVQPRVTKSGTQFTASTPPGSYPVGETVLSVLPANAATWPIGHSSGGGAIHTLRRIGDTADDTTSVWQWAYRTGSNRAGEEVWFRSGSTTVWAPWILVIGPPLPAPATFKDDTTMVITSTVRNTETPRQIRASVKNSNPAKNMLLWCLAYSWVEFTSFDGCAFYHDPGVVSGGTILDPYVADRLENVTEGTQDSYASSRAECLVRVPPLSTVTMRMEANKTVAAGDVQFKLNNIHLIPLRYE